MLRIAILEKEEVAKDILFELANIICDVDWTFQYFTKISEFAKADQKHPFAMVFFDEQYHNERVSASFVESVSDRIVIYCMEQLKPSLRELYPTSRIFYIDAQNIKQEMKRIAEHIQSLLRFHEEYLLDYNNVHIALRIQDIYYIEKNTKYLIYHTRKGDFYERKTMSEAEQLFARFDFLRIHASYLVNVQHIIKIEQDTMELDNHESLQIARLRKKDVIQWFHDYVKKGI